MVDVIKKLASGNAGDIADELHELRTSPIPSIIQRAVVVEVLDDLSLRDYSDLEAFEDAMASWGSDEFPLNMLNAEELQQAPRGSLVVKFINQGRGRTDKTVFMCYPFFSSHFSLPVKVGEQVWVLQETPAQPSAKCFWLSRIHEPLFVEDANYTHGDRRYDALTPDENKDLDPDMDEIDLTTIPTYHNGKEKGIDKDGKPLERDADLFTLTSENDYEAFIDKTLENNQFVFEPVPRYTKRPGDLVLQGSHNAMIVLGTDRGYKAGDPIDREKSNASPKDALTPGKGTIDLVVGRGRIYVDPNDLDGTAERKIEPTRCDPRVIKSLGRVHPETDKNLEVVDPKKFTNHKTDASEGDPDFVNDASRIYASMKTNPDENFALEYPKVPPAGDANDGQDVEPAKDSAAIVVKSDEIRIIARKMGLDNQKDSEYSKDNKPKEPIVGSIKLVKEGKPDDEGGDGRAVIMMQPDGVIMIDGPKIVIGSGIEKGNGEGAQVCLGLGATEPLVLGHELKSLLEDLLAALKAHKHPSGTGPTGPPLPPDIMEFDTIKGELDKMLSKNGKTK